MPDIGSLDLPKSLGHMAYKGYVDLEGNSSFLNPRPGVLHYSFSFNMRPYLCELNLIAYRGHLSSYCLD